MSISTCLISNNNNNNFRYVAVRWLCVNGLTYKRVMICVHLSQVCDHLKCSKIWKILVLTNSPADFPYTKSM